MNDLNGKVAVVTGAGKGIGRGIAKGLAASGAAVCCVARTKADIEGVAGEIKAGGGSAVAVVADVTKPDSVKKMFAAAEVALGGIDIVFVNAGGNLHGGPIGEDTIQDWDVTIDVNLNSAYYTTRIAVPYLRKRGGGKIIMTGSGMGHRGRAGSAAYCCAKAGLWMLARVLAQEVADDNISVNELIPGPVITDRTKHMANGSGSVFGISTEWVKQPGDVVPMALFLATQPDRGPTAQSFSIMRRDN